MKRNFLTFNDLGEEYAQYAQDIRRGTPTAVFGVSDPYTNAEFLLVVFTHYLFDV